MFQYAKSFLGFALACMTISGATAAAAPAPDESRLAFTSLSLLKPHGFTVRTIGIEIARPLVLVRGSRRDVVPNPFGGLAWSADGGQLAFTASKGRRDGIYVVRADGTGLHFLRGTGGGSNPVFSPDGGKIAFARNGTGKFTFAATPWVADVNGGGVRRLIEWRKNVEYLPSSFSPDGLGLAVTASRLVDPPKALLLALKGGNARLLARRAAEPAFSPDGSQIAFVRHSISRRQITHKDLYVMSAKGGTRARPLTRTRWIAESHPTWDPSGQRIAFNSFRIGKDPFEALFDELLPVGNSIVQINADGTCRQKVFSLRNAAIYGAAWRSGIGHEVQPIECWVAKFRPE